MAKKVLGEFNEQGERQRPYRGEEAALVEAVNNLPPSAFTYLHIVTTTDTPTNISERAHLAHITGHESFEDYLEVRATEENTTPEAILEQMIKEADQIDSGTLPTEPEEPYAQGYLHNTELNESGAYGP